MIIEQSEAIINEVGKVLIGKDEIIKKVLMAIYSGGHVLLEDFPGVGKTTLALGFSKALGLEYKRVQFTPDTMPSDIIGYSSLSKNGEEMIYRPGAVYTNLFLGDEINRTSAKTQSALLEAMEEGSVTVDGQTYNLPTPFICIATQNPVGSAGTQLLPESQLDRFIVRLSIGYPSPDEMVEILERKKYVNPMDSVTTVTTRDQILEVQNYLGSIRMSKDIARYIANLCEATHNDDYIELGVSPRGALALSRMARANALMNERDYVIPEDVRYVFKDVCAHRLVLKPKVRIEGMDAYSVLDQILEKTPVPSRG